MSTLNSILSEYMNKTIEVNTVGGESGVKGQLLVVGDDYIILNPASAWDEDVIRIIPYSAIDYIDVAQDQ